MSWIRIPMETTLGAHRMPREVVVAAQRRGLRTSYTHDGGWWTRHHALTISGDTAKLVPFRRVLDRWLSQFDHVSDHD